MELPFSYIVLSCVKMLQERGMEPIVEKRRLILFIGEIVKRNFFTIKEKNEIIDNFNFQYECDKFIEKYYGYFDMIEGNIIFDSDFADELNDWINEEIEENDFIIIDDVDYTIESHTIFLEILGVNLNKELYEYLLDIDCELESAYSELSIFDNCIENCSENIESLINKIKKLLYKRMILLMNTKNLLSNIEYNDLRRYSYDKSMNNCDYDDLPFLYDDEYFDKTTIWEDVFKRSIFTCDQLCFSTLNSKLNNQFDDKTNSIKCIEYSKLKFYLTYLDLLEEEKKKENEIYNELVIVKYRLMQAIDMTYDILVYRNRNIINDISFEENYIFVEYDVYYFINELLMYDDSKYKNEDFNIENITIYTYNTIKKLFIATYYKLTKDKRIINSIKNNQLYGINKISSSLLDEIVTNANEKIKN